MVGWYLWHMRRLAVLTVLMALVATACLRVPADKRGQRFGYAINPHALESDADYAARVAADANTITFENHTKWGLVQPQEGVFDFTRADQIADFAEAHDIDLRGHVLVWHRQLPEWVTERDWTRDELIEAMRSHIHTVVGHFRDEYPGRVVHWDVVNEAFLPNGQRRPTLFQRVIGDDYIELAFRFAHEADPSVRLFYNDFFDNGIVLGEALTEGYEIAQGATSDITSCDEVPKCVSTRALADSLVKRGVPIDGIGFQGHVFGTSPTDYGEFTSWTAGLGLDWALTEIDVALPAGGNTPEALADQADAYRKMLRSCLYSKNCDTTIVWGVTDAYSWIPATTLGLFDHALLYDSDALPKPAYWSLLGELAGGSGP